MHPLSDLAGLIFAIEYVALTLYRCHQRSTNSHPAVASEIAERSVPPEELE